MRSPSYWLVSQEIARNGTRTVLFTRRLSFHLLFTSKIRDREEGIVIYSFYTWFSFLTWVWVNIFLEIVSRKTATTHIFQSGVRNWPASVSRREIEVFNPQAWDSRLRRESWQVYFCRSYFDFHLSLSLYWNRPFYLNSLIFNCALKTNS